MAHISLSCFYKEQVADCICLMSLNHLEAIPVDTHVLKIATAYYLPHERQIKSMTPKLYTEIGDAFRNVYGPLAGWAQTVLFCADLAKFKKIADENGCSKAKKKRKWMNAPFSFEPSNNKLIIKY